MEFNNTPTVPVHWCLPEEVRAHLTLDTCSRWPEEACGLLFGNPSLNQSRTVISQYLPLRNTAAAPRHHFLLEPVEWVRHCRRGDFLGIYHSHPTAAPVPSALDLKNLQTYGAMIRLYIIGSCFPDITQQPPGVPGGCVLEGYEVTEAESGGLTLSQVRFLPLEEA